MNIGTIIVAILVFGVLIFVHELGHYLVARWSGVQVNEFALGMGPVLFKVVRGETQYSLRLVPFGGFCSMEGDDEESDNPHAFGKAPVVRRILIIVSGAVMNLLLGFAILTFLSAQQDYFGSTVVHDFHEGATSSGQLQERDKILEVNGHRVRTDNDLRYEFMRDRDGVMTMLVERGGERVRLDNVTFQMRELEDGTQAIVVDFRIQAVEKTIGGVIANSLNWTQSIIKTVWGSLVDLVTGRYGLNQLSGPVGVTTVIGEATSMGWEPLLQLVSFITVNLGVFNLLPLPALDGGRLLFLLLEAVRRKPVNPKYEGWVHAVGFMLLIGLMVVVTFNDVAKLF